MSSNNRFPGVVLGLSGGVDSALCAAMAVDALGRERVHAVMLPYRIHLDGVARATPRPAPRRSAFATTSCRSPSRSRRVERALAPMFAGRPRDITEENIQSRARGLILMAISNKFGAMVVTTGNKSEMSVGYATLYGDMNGGFNPIKDLYKMEVFRLSALRNRWKPDGRARAGRRGHPGRHHHQAAERRTARKPEGRGFAAALSRARRHPARAGREGDAASPRSSRRAMIPRRCGAIERLLYLAEYKRRQSAPGVKVGPKNFGRDRRYPIVNRFRDPGAAARAPDATIAPPASLGSAERFED